MASIKEVLRANGFNPTSQIYSTPSVSVYKGVYNSSEVIYKVLPLRQSHDYDLITRECNTMQQLQHPNIVKLYAFHWIQTSQVYYLVMVLELCDKDLGKDCRDRLKSDYKYQETELWTMAVDLVRTYAWLQRQQIAHRDIKPENIFLLNGVLKVGDFGASRYLIADEADATTVGTPSYLSPKLREGLMRHSSSVTHNAYKSDVFSLGLTLLALALLGPTRLPLNYSETGFRQVVESIGYSEQFKQLIYWMINYQEEHRPDFIQLQEWFDKQLAEQSSWSSAEQAQAAYPEPSQGSSQAYNSPAFQPPPVEETKIPSHESRQRVLPSPSTPQCLTCSKALPRRKMTRDTVQLTCDPDSHFCCSMKCIQELVRPARPVCPACQTDIDEDTVRFYRCVDDPGHHPVQGHLQVVKLFILALLLSLYSMLRAIYSKAFRH